MILSEYRCSMTKYDSFSNTFAVLCPFRPEPQRSGGISMFFRVEYVKIPPPRIYDLHCAPVPAVAGSVGMTNG